MPQMREPIMTVLCHEPGGDHERSIYLCELSFEKLQSLYAHISKFKVLFNDFIRENVDAFIKSFVTIDQYGEVFSNGVVWEVDDVGILYLTDIRPGASASAHFSFWDRRIKGREELIRKMLRYCFDQFKLHRIEAEIPLISAPALGAVERMGFTKEGRKRDVLRYDGVWVDVNVYSILEDEV